MAVRRGNKRGVDSAILVTDFDRFLDVGKYFRLEYNEGIFQVVEGIRDTNCAKCCFKNNCFEYPRPACSAIERKDDKFVHFERIY